MAKHQNTDNSISWWECGETENFSHCWWEYKMFLSFWKTSRNFPIKLCLIYNTIFTIFSKTYLKFIFIQKPTHTWMFIRAWFIVSHTYKHPKCPSLYERINNPWYIHSVSITQHWKEMSCETIKRHGRNSPATEWKRMIFKSYILCDSNYLAFWKWKDHRRKVSGLEEGRNA
jgi:hypothetical protein